MFRKCKEIDQNYFLNHPVLKNHMPLLEKVKNAFNPQDDIFFLKAPGRVNLIGEHTDYNMGPVLPCAISREIVFCIRPGKTSEIKAHNVDEKFNSIDFSIHQKIEPYTKGNWGNYIKAGIKGILDYVKFSTPQNIKLFKGCDILVSSTLPQAAGISSSSALVVASALSFVLLNKIDLNKQKIAEICAKAEHFVGTAGGGMDQAASLLGKKNSFLYMEFNPLRIEQIAAPQGIQLILFYSMIQAEKSGKSREEYNRRVLECKMGIDLFNRFFRQFAEKYQTVDFIGEIKAERFKLQPIELDQWVDRFLIELPDTFSITEFSTIMGLSALKLGHRYRPVLKGGDQFKEPQGGFKIKSRFKHVYSECRRVQKTVDCLRNNNLNDLGNLINQSHHSLSEDYEVSLPEVNELVHILCENGAYGARIMGAGFGGMVLAYTDVSKMDHLISKAKEKYYSNRMPGDHNDNIFPCVAADGAGVL